MTRMKSARGMIVLTAVLAVVYYGTFSRVASFTGYADFGGDIWEYQSMAVNFAKGHGIARFGGIEDFSVYSFETDPAVSRVMPAPLEHFLKAGKNGGVEWFFRTPGYYLFLGVIYKIFGVSPLIAEHIQLILLATVAASLPLIGRHYWHKTGFWSGLIASPIAIASNYRFSGVLYTESLITFAVFLIVVAYALFEARRTVPRALLVGIALGLGLLVKGSLVFIPPLLGLFLCFRWLWTRRTSDFVHLSAIIVAAVLTIAPWSIYASTQSGRFILLSTQAESILLDSHNEYVTNGAWYQEWRDDPQSFYNNDGLEGRSALLRVANFYRHHPILLPRIALEKLVAGFRPFPFLLVGGVLAFAEGCLLLWGRMRGTPRESHTHIPLIFLIIFINFALITVLVHVSHVVYYSRIVKPMEFLFILFGVHRTLLLLCAVLRPFFGRFILGVVPG